MREFRTSGSVGGRGGKPPWSTRRFLGTDLPQAGILRVVEEQRPDAVGISATMLAPRHQGSGLGLGLAIARDLIELQGGTIEAASEGPGRGTTVTVRLPRYPRPDV